MNKQELAKGWMESVLGIKMKRDFASSLCNGVGSILVVIVDLLTI